MAINPSIALGVRGIEVANPLAQYGQIAAIQNAQNQNALAQFQLGSARRQEESQNALNKAWGEAVDPSTGKVDYNKLTGLLAAGGAAQQIPAILKQQTEAQAAATAEAQHRAKLAIDKTAMYRDMVSQIETPDQAIKWLQIQVNDPDMAGTPITKRPLMEMASAIPTTPAEFENWKNKQALGMTEFVKQNKPVTFSQDTGGGGRVLTRAGLGGAATVVPGSEFTKTQTFADINAAARLAFDKQKFAWEKANPGFELKEAEDGSIVGVNKRTLEAFPVTVGGAAPTAAPVAGVGMPGERIPAIPGMTSVLDQQAPTTAPAAGVPLMGKGTAMTEAQSNAAMFGGAMAQAQNTIKQLEKSGTVKNAVVPGLLTGLAQMVPFGVGESIGNVIQSTFNADPTGLIGPNAAQQKLAQAQLAFATAYLRKTSGAAFGASEVANTIKEFFPLIGEGEKVIAQKAAARERAIEGMKMSTSKEGKKYIENYGVGGVPSAAGGGGIPGATATNPLGLAIPGVK